MHVKRPENELSFWTRDALRLPRIDFSPGTGGVIVVLGKLGGGAGRRPIGNCRFVRVNALGDRR